MRTFKPFIFLLLLASFNFANAQSWYEQKMATWTLRQIQDSFYSTHRVKNDFVKKDDFDYENEEDESDILFLRWESFWKEKIAPDEHFPSLSRTYDAWAEYIKNHQNIAYRGLSQANWTFKGPSTAEWGNGIGRLKCIAFHPSDTSTFWVGAAEGGLWKTTNGGNSWTVNSVSMVNTGVEEVVIDPSNPNIMFLITGGTWGGVTRSLGVLKSTDGGNTWNTTGLIYPGSTSIYFRRIAMHPTNHNILFVAASNGIWKTTDGGTTWTQQYSSKEFHDVKFNPANPSIVYATTHINVNGFSAEIYRSTNTGNSWTLIKTIAGGDRTFLAVTPANPALVMSVSPNSSGGLLGLCKSTDSGATFNMYYTANGSNNLLGSYLGASRGQGWHDLALAINPFNANDVLVGGIITYRSTDGGMQWEQKYGMHADQQYLAYNPLMPNTVFECNDGGIYKSQDTGNTWTNLTHGLGISQIYRISAANTINDKVLCGLQDNGTQHLTNQRWNETQGGDGFKCIIDDNDTSIMYCTAQSGLVYKTYNGGVSWNLIVNTWGTGINVYGNFSTNFTMDPTNHSVLYMGKSQIYKSTDGGATWLQTGTISNVQASDWFITVAPSNPQIVYAGNTLGFYKSTNGGASWTTLTPPAYYGNSITVDPNNANKLWFTSTYISGPGVVFKSVNGGLSFTDITGSIPANIGAGSCVYQIGSKGGIYIGTEIGVFYRDSTMSDWLFYSDGLPNINVRDLQISYASGKLWAGTYGRGLWNTDLYTATLPLNLLEFTARAVDFTSVLKWKTANEINVDHFIVEKSANGREFTAIGTVKANAAPNGTGNYYFTDPTRNEKQATVFYRLKMLDKDGQFTFSPIRVINNNSTFNITIYPNPTKDNLQVSISSNKKTTLQLQVLSLDGKMILSNSVNAVEGFILRSINISSLQKGNYLLKVSAADKEENVVRFEKI